MWRWVLISFWLIGSPSFGQSTSLIYTDEAGSSVKKALLKEADKDVRAFFADTFSQVIDKPTILVGTSEPEKINSHLMKALQDINRSPRRSPIDAAKLCENKAIGAAANRPYIVMCWRKPETHDAAWGASIRPRLTAILAHEFAHQLQYHLSQDDPAKFVGETKEQLFGPSWLVEGSAEVFERLFQVQVQGKDADDDASQILFNMQSPARRSRLTLSELTAAGSTKGRGAYGTARFAAFLLAERNGNDALFRYFEVLGQVKNRDVAFSQVFGFSFEEFEIDFERVRRNFAAATEYAAGGGQ